MSETGNAGFAPSSFIDATNSWIHVEILSKILAEAAASVDSDKRKVKTCIHRAEDFLRTWRTRERQLFRNGLVSRGIGLAPWRKIRVSAYVDANLGSQITVGELAGSVQLSTGHFFRAFRESFGESPLVYVAKQRVQRSQQLMLNSRATLAQIATECGMSDQSHFTRVFHKFVGLNPSVWRRLASSTLGLPPPAHQVTDPTVGLTVPRLQFGARAWCSRTTAASGIARHNEEDALGNEQSGRGAAGEC